MAFDASFLISMAFQLLPQRQVRSIVLAELGNIWGWVVGRLGDNFTGEPGAPLDRIGLSAVGKSRQNAGLRQKSATVAIENWGPSMILPPAVKTASIEFRKPAI